MPSDVEVTASLALKEIANDTVACVVCSLNGHKRDAVARTLLRGGHVRYSCGLHALTPAVVNGVNQVIGVAPLVQPRHVVVARAALTKISARHDNCDCTVCRPWTY